MSGLSETIIRLRTEKGWTQQEFADLLIVSRSLVAMWEQGTRKPDFLIIERMAELFGITVGELVPDNHYVFFSIMSMVLNGKKISRYATAFQKNCCIAYFDMLYSNPR